MDEENKGIEEGQSEVEETVEEVKSEPAQEETKGSESGFKGKAIIAVVAVIILLVLVTKLGGKKTSNETPTETPTPTANVIIYKVEEPVESGNVVVTVNKTDVSKGTGEALPTEGYEWFNVNLTIENKSEEALSVKTLESMKLTDGNGVNYEPVAADIAKGSVIDGSVKAGAKRTGWVGFEVKIGVTKLQLTVDAAGFGGETIVFDLE